MAHSPHRTSLHVPPTPPPLPFSPSLTDLLMDGGMGGTLGSLLCCRWGMRFLRLLRLSAASASFSLGEMGSSAPLALLPLLSTLAGAPEEEAAALKALPPPSDDSPRLLARVLMARLADATRGVWLNDVRFFLLPAKGDSKRQLVSLAALGRHTFEICVTDLCARIASPRCMPACALPGEDAWLWPQLASAPPRSSTPVRKVLRTCPNSRPLKIRPLWEGFRGPPEGQNLRKVCPRAPPFECMGVRVPRTTQSDSAS